MKAWITNHHVCSKLSWVLLIHNFPRSQADEWQKCIQSYYRKWMGLAKSAEPSILYRSRCNFGLKFKHLGEMQDQLQVTRWHIIKSSNDPNARKLYAHRLKRDQEGHVGTGRKTTPRLMLEELEAQVDHDELVPPHPGRTGLGYIHKRNETRRQRVIKVMKDDNNKKRLVKSTRCRIAG